MEKLGKVHLQNAQKHLRKSDIFTKNVTLLQVFFSYTLQV